ncbi:MAG TPA: hypothetical protein VGB73_20255 [Pyrinomonadaceae bacterium]|jgi:hypothetical protein
MPIKDADYNAARTILIQAGSLSASKSHVKHTGKRGSPDGHGVSLLQEAKAEFDEMSEPHKGAGMIALNKAAKRMGLDASNL